MHNLCSPAFLGKVHYYIKRNIPDNHLRILHHLLVGSGRILQSLNNQFGSRLCHQFYRLLYRCHRRMYQHAEGLPEMQVIAISPGIEK